MGYYKGEEIVACYEADITALVPKTDTTNRKAKGQYTKADFSYDAERNEFVCPAGERLTYRFDSVEKGNATGQAPRRTSLRHHQALDGINALFEESIYSRSISTNIGKSTVGRKQ